MKALEPQPYILPGVYEGLITAHTVKVKLNTDEFSDPIQLDGGFRGRNILCKVVVDENGNLETTNI